MPFVAQLLFRLEHKLLKLSVLKTCFHQECLKISDNELQLLFVPFVLLHKAIAVEQKNVDIAAFLCLQEAWCAL